MAFEDLIKQNKVPTLFIGSGISKRYLKGYPTWFELLKKIAGEIGVTPLMLNAMKTEIINKNDSLSSTEINAMLADKLSEKINELIINADEKVNSFLTLREQEQLGMYNSDCFKYLVSKEFSNYSIKEDKLEEIKLFRNAAMKVGSVITTNYDEFLEKEIFRNFEVKYNQSQLYFVNNYEYECIYKIHGTTNRPESIVINSRDYRKMSDNHRLFIAKIYDLLMSSPMIFLGYGMGDDDILKILSDFTECFDSMMLMNIAKNIILVEYKEGENELIESQQIIKANGKDIPITIIQTDNFSKVYDVISKFELFLSPCEANKYRKILKKLVKDNENGLNKIRVVGEENIINADPNKLIVALGPNAVIKQIQEYGIIGMTLSDIVKNVLFRTETNIDSIIERWSVENLQKNHSLPAFYLANKYNKDFSQHVKFKTNYDYLYEKFKKKYKEIGALNINVTHDDIMKMSLANDLNSSIEGKNLYFARIKDIITSDELRYILKEIYIRNNTVVKKTQFKELVCFSDFELVYKGE